MRLTRAGQGGPDTALVSGRSFPVPRGTIVALSNSSRGHFAWALEPAGTVRAFVKAGEVAVPDDVATSVRREVFGLR